MSGIHRDGTSNGRRRDSLKTSVLLQAAEKGFSRSDFARVMNGLLIRDTIFGHFGCSTRPLIGTRADCGQSHPVANSRGCRITSSAAA
jgi:hypothetical protein